MDLQAILAKTKEKSDKIKRHKNTVQIAIEDRPYDIPESPEAGPLETKESNYDVSPTIVVTPATNSTQTQHKLNTQPHTDLTQTKHKANTKSTQTSHNPVAFLSTLTQSQHKPYTKLNTRRDTNETQSQHKLNTNPSLSTLVGLQRKLLFFVYASCKKTRGKVSEPLTVDHITTLLNIRPGSVKTTMARLEAKQVISKVSFKNGRGGWSTYEIPDPIYRELLHLESEHKLDTILTQTQHKPNTQLDTELNTGPLSSSNINKTTTTDGLPEDWQKINLAPLADIGFAEKHLTDIFQTKLATPEIVQDSINHFAYGLEHNSAKYKTYADPLNVLIGCLRKGKSWYESNYVSPQEKALKDLIQRKKAEKDRLNTLEDELISVEFEEWKTGLTADEKKQYLPAKVFGPEDAHLKAYFVNYIWSEVRSQLIKNS